MTTSPPPHGLHDPALARAACGVGFVAKLGGERSHECVRRALTSLENMEHRGAEGADADTGDGAGILLQVPDELLRADMGGVLPAPGRYGIAVCFLPREDERRAELERVLEDAVCARGQGVLGWRDVPVDPAEVGEVARRTAPIIRQLVAIAAEDIDEDAFERSLYLARGAAERATDFELVVPSFSARTVVYKGMLSAPQLGRFYRDLADERLRSALALVHSRFSTNTFPSWELAHPYRMIAHNGEVNTLMGNRNWMRARESQLASDLLGEGLVEALPVIRPGASDSKAIDNALELLVMAGRSLPHAVKMLIPEAHEGRDDLPEGLADFYDYHSCLTEAWDGPASVSFTDGRVIGATLDRNGLRPGRWLETRDGWVICASEAGTIELEPGEVLRKGRLKPGALLLVDVEAGCVLADREVERELAARRPYGRWYREQTVRLDELPEPRTERASPDGAASAPAEPLRRRQLAFGWTQEDLRVLLAPMVDDAKEPNGSMGSDVPLAVLSDRDPPLFAYFKQLFAQVTNPAIDPVREETVMSLRTAVGPIGNLLSEGPRHGHQLVMDTPVLRDLELERLRRVRHEVLAARTLDATWARAEGAVGLERALERLCEEASTAVAEGVNVLVLSDRAVGRQRVPVPSLLALSSVHHHLVREGTRLRAGLVVESGEPREVHHVACLIGYGASAVNPYLMLESVGELTAFDEIEVEAPTGRLLDDPVEVDDRGEAEARLVRALNKGLLKILSKMGVSTIQSYCGAQIFEAVGLDAELVERHFTGTASRIGGVGLEVLAAEAMARHALAWPEPDWELLPVGGIYAWRRDGEFHMWSPRTVTALQRAVGLPPARPGASRNGAAASDTTAYEEFAEQVNQDAVRRAALRGLLRLRTEGEGLALEEVEPAAELMKRFSTGAMSLGSISPEAHETLAVAMNRMSGRSNTGEGGEDPRRYRPDPNGDARRSAIKQVASARFGVTIGYLADADQLQIKISQGSKPGEGGQLPGGKVDDYIAKLRFATPGVELISPPPHHDIYSIEDLKQLIYDLRCSNPRATVSVKLAAEIGVGTVAAGVCKAGADHVTIAGHEGGTGSSPLSSIQSAGLPWELGLAETQQTLVRESLRSRIRVEVDGQMKTGRDVVVAGLLGAEEMAFSTAPLIATGCVMMRVCHLNTCPVGIATQDPELRRRFAGAPEHVVAYFAHVAEEARRLMAALGVRRFDDLVGRVDLLEPDPEVNHPKARRIDLSDLLKRPDVASDAPIRQIEAQRSVLDDALDHEILAAARPAIERRTPVRLAYRVRNVNRAVGGLLSNAIARAHGDEGLPEGAIELLFEGSAGQSFGAWLAPGVVATLRGEANDYAGKGLSGGVLAVRAPDDATYSAEENVIVGNTVLYGATGGRAFFGGLAGERFAVRNSGAHAVVEGVGDHGCEYMTGGRVAVLGATGRNFAAGMSGGVAYVLDEDGGFERRCNLELVDLEALGDEAARELRALVAEHGERTGSPVAAGILDDWDRALERFVKVIPRDFKRALEELEADEESASSPSEPAPEPAAA
ncbi:MAG TPA: glutamate synthase large subunit [Thermoleophilaceae bacterium]|nr:glutamate synthase large subunit [Thermoleophilaceae bacterium]